MPNILEVKKELAEKEIYTRVLTNLFTEMG